MPIKERVMIERRIFETEKFRIVPMQSSTKNETALWIVNTETDEGTECDLDLFNEQFQKLFDEIM